MTRRISKRTGRAYTEGSQSTPEPGFPNLCCRCGQRVYTSREEYQHHTDDVTGQQQAWHLPTCPPQALRGPPRVSALSAERAPKVSEQATSGVSAVADTRSGGGQP